MTDPLTTAAATTAVTAATAWLWTKFGDKIIELASSHTKAAWKHLNWKAASASPGAS